MASLIYRPNDPAHRQVFPLGTATLIVGREPGSQIFLASKSVSRNHASIIYEGKNFIVADNGSTNGTLVNGEKITRYILKHGDVIVFGDYTFTFYNEEEIAQEGKKSVPLEFKAKDAKVTGSGASYRAVVNLKPRVVSRRKNRDLTEVRSVQVMLTNPVARSVPAPQMFPSVKRASLSTSQWVSIIIAAIILTFVGASFFFINRGKSDKKKEIPVQVLMPSTNIQVPTVSMAAPLFSGPMIWAHFLRQQTAVLSSQRDTGALILPGNSGDSTGAGQDYLSTWRRGIVIYEPAVIRVELAPNSKDTIHLILEDCNYPPTFWGFNSTVTPEKTPVVGPFYIPNLRNSIFYRRNPRLAAKIQKFNGEEFPWRMAEKGVEWSLAGQMINFQRDAAYLHWMVFLRPAIATSTLTINTREGDLLRNMDKQYQYDVYPAEVLAEVLYWGNVNSLVAVRLNKSLYSSRETEDVKRMIEYNFSAIMSNRPSPTSVEIPKPFTLPSVKK